MIGAILQGAASLTQATMGVAQMAAGFLQKKPKLEEYTIPDEVLQNMSQADRMQYEGLPQAQKEQFIQNIQRAGASALSSSTSRKGGLGLISSVAQQQSDQYMNLLSADSQARMNNMSNLFTARSAVAAEREKKFNIKRENTLEKRASIDALRGAGMQNTMGAVSSFAENYTGSKKTGKIDPTQNPITGGTMRTFGNVNTDSSPGF